MRATLDSQHTIGQGNAHGHHGELIQGVFEDSEGALLSGLITLPFNNVFSNVTFHPDGTDTVKLSNNEKLKSKKAAELTSLYIHGNIVGGHLNINGDTPVGKGLGSSTTDVVSTIKAVAGSLSKLLTNNEVAKIAVEAEKASDSIMFSDQSVLFAQRKGKVLKYFEGSLPELCIVGFDTAENNEIVDTLTLNKPDYTNEEKTTFQMMKKLVNHAIQNEDSSLLGCAATASAKINQKYSPKPNFEELLHITEKNKGVGIQVAHSGTVAGIMFNPHDKRFNEIINITKNDLKSLGYNSYHFFV